MQLYRGLPVLDGCTCADLTSTCTVEPLVGTCRFVEPLRTGLAFLDGRIALKPGHLLEVVGPSGTAKSELLLQVSPTRIQASCKQHCVEIALLQVSPSLTAKCKVGYVT